MKITAETKRENNYKLSLSVKRIIYALLCFAVGALFGGINELGVFSPFGIAYLVSVPDKLLIPASVGVATGYILTQDSLSALRYIAATLSACVIIKLIRESEKLKKFRLLPSFTAFLTLILTSLVVLASYPTDIKSFLVFVGEAVIGFISAYFLSSAFGAFELFNLQKGFSIKDIASITFFLNLFLFSFDRISFFDVSPSRILATFLILLMSYIYKEAGSTISAIASTLIFSMSSSVGTFGVLFCISGFVSSAFSNLGKYFSSVVFFAVYSTLFLLNGGGYENKYLVFECLIACVLFSTLKNDVLEKISNYFVIRDEPKATEIQRRVVLDKLKSSSAAVESMTNSIAAAAGLLKYKNFDNDIKTFSKIKEQVCESCRHKEFCWEKNFDDSNKAFNEMSEILKNCGMVNRTNLPKYLSGCCVNAEKLTDVFNRTYLNYISAQASQNKIEKIRQVASQQFGSVYTVLSETSQSFEEGIRFDFTRADRIEEMLLNKFKLKADSVLCIVDENDKLKIEMNFSGKLKKNRESDLRPALEEICEVQFDKPVITENGQAITICICQRTKFRVEIAVARAIADKSKHCGDNFESFYDGKGNYTVVLSDGMGTGMRAAVDSSLAVCVAGKLLRAGFNYDSALRLTNCAMLLKSVEESLATLDILKINLYTGEVQFYKAGAASSFIKKNEKIIEVKKASMPIGILSEMSFEQISESMKEGDIALLASDGAFEYSGDAVKNSLAVALDESVEEIAERSATKAKRENKSKHIDDITVIAIRLVKNM